MKPKHFLYLFLLRTCHFRCSFWPETDLHKFHVRHPPLTKLQRFLENGAPSFKSNINQRGPPSAGEVFHVFPPTHFYKGTVHLKPDVSNATHTFFFIPSPTSELS